MDEKITLTYAQMLNEFAVCTSFEKKFNCHKSFIF